MIAIVPVEIQAANPSMPLYPWRAYVNSPSSLRVRNVPRKVGNWSIDRVYVTAAYPDNSIKTAECVLVGGVWVCTIEGSTSPGESQNGYTIYADGVDENGDRVTGYVLGKGCISILENDGTITPGETTYYVHLLSSQPASPKEGDLWQLSGSWYIWQDGTAYPIGDDSGLISQLSSELSTKQDVLEDAQISAIDSIVSARATEMVFDDDSISAFNWDGEVSREDMIDAGLFDQERNTWRKNPVDVKLGNAVTSIGKAAFQDCQSLTSITIPESVERFGDEAFNNCASLKSINIPESVKSIGVGAFQICQSLTSMTIPESVVSIGFTAFLFCDNLKSLIFKGKTLAEVQAMANYPWGIIDTSIISTWNDASQEFVESKLSGYVQTSAFTQLQTQVTNLESIVGQANTALEEIA